MKTRVLFSRLVHVTEGVEGVSGAVTSDCSREGVGKLLHVFSLCLCLVVLSSEDNLHGTLGNTRGKQLKTEKEIKKFGKLIKKNKKNTLAPMTATSAVGQA